MSERDINRLGTESKIPLSAHGQQLPNSKSVPALHHVGNMSMLICNTFYLFFLPN